MDRILKRRKVVGIRKTIPIETLFIIIIIILCSLFRNSNFTDFNAFIGLKKNYRENENTD